MRMIDELTLRSVITSANDKGFKVETAASNIVFASVKSVKRSEFYGAQAAGVTVDVVFEINTDEYNGQTEVEHDFVRYDVTRTYQSGRGRTELVCTKAVIA